ncbi:MAG: hypothetical protein L0Y54_16695 [Sporichthyaceae bacterium]|nr:hypothetical protein [Sporichthyaceae bacterium]
MIWFVVLIGLVAGERLAELVVARRNRDIALAQGGIEVGQGHYPVMVALHSGLLGGALAEVYLLDRPSHPVIGPVMLALVLAAQGLRWWCIRTLSTQWNTRIIVVPGLTRVAAGPYRWLRHPNYLAVVAEGFALPLVHGAWLTAVVFTVLNLPLLWHRIQIEERAMRVLVGSPAP